MRISDWSSDVCSSDLLAHSTNIRLPAGYGDGVINTAAYSWQWMAATYKMAERYYTRNGLPIDEDLTFNMGTMHELTQTPGLLDPEYDERSEEHTSELQSLMRISYAVLCLKKKNTKHTKNENKDYACTKKKLE